MNSEFPSFKNEKLMSRFIIKVFLSAQTQQEKKSTHLHKSHLDYTLDI